MPLRSRNAQTIYVLPHRRELIAAEAGKRRFLETLAAWVLMLALVLVVTVAALWLATWLDETQTTFRSQHDLSVNSMADFGVSSAKRPHRRELQSPRQSASGSIGIQDVLELNDRGNRIMDSCKAG